MNGRKGWISPNRGTGASLLVMVLLWSGIVAFHEPILAQERSAPSRAELEQLLSRADLLLEELSRLRGLPVKMPIKKVIRSKAEIAQYLREEVSRKFPRERVEAEQKALAKFGLISPAFDLERFYVALLTEQAAAYYDPRRKEMVLADWLPAILQQVALLHELVHVLQDQALDLERYLDPLMNSDQLLARQAVIEGEATALTLDFLLAKQGLDLTKVPDLAALSSLFLTMQEAPVLASAPKFLKDQLLFPYFAGTAFAQYFKRSRPWQAFTAVYADPPKSTRQLLHPERYFDSRDDPKPVTLADQTRLLSGHWRLTHEDDLGAFGLAAVLERFLDGGEAGKMADGLSGDRYQFYEEGSQPRGFLLYLTTWEAPAKAHAFFEAYSALVEKKYPDIASSRQELTGLRRWTQGEEVVAVELRGQDVLILEGVPTASFQAIQEGVWRNRAP